MSSQGLYRYNRTTNDFTIIKDVPSSSHVFAITEDKESNIWCGTKGEGAFFFNPLTKKSGSYKHVKDSKSLISNYINDILADSDNNLWMATEDGGLSKLTQNTGIFTSYTVRDGLPSNFLFRIIEDDEKKLWISTSGGLVRLDPQTKKIRKYSKANGLLNDQFNFNSGYKDSSGKIYFGSVKGLISFNPKTFVTDTFVPPVYITGFQVHNKELPIQKNSALEQSIHFTTKLSLSYNKSSFSIDFAFTLGSSGSGGRSFMEDVAQADNNNIFSAVIGGVIFNAANILLVAAIAIAGMAVAFPVGIGLALVIGVVVNYIANPVGNQLLLFGGVALIVIAIILNANAYRKMQSGNKNTSSKKGLLLSIVAGVLMGFFYKYVAAAMFTDFNVPEAGKLSPYTAVVFFSFGILLSNFLFNTLLMRKPFVGAPVSYADYFKGGVKNHITGILGGAIWCVGMSFSIIASGKAGPAISYGLGQGATVVAAVWGIFIWKEFRNAPKGTSAVLNTMLLLYLAGLSLIIAAR